MYFWSHWWLVCAAHKLWRLGNQTNHWILWYRCTTWSKISKWHGEIPGTVWHDFQTLMAYDASNVSEWFNPRNSMNADSHLNEGKDPWNKHQCGTHVFGWSNPLRWLRPWRVWILWGTPPSRELSGTLGSKWGRIGSLSRASTKAGGGFNVNFGKSIWKRRKCKDKKENAKPREPPTRQRVRCGDGQLWCFLNVGKFSKCFPVSNIWYNAELANTNDPSKGSYN